MQITISVSHTFEDATLFAAFAPELKAFLDKFFSGPASLPAVPETRGMMPRESATVVAPPAVPLPPREAQPASSLIGSGGTGGNPIALEFPGPVAGVAAYAPAAEETPTVDSSSLSQSASTSVEAPAKRKRRTKAEMAAARASGAVAPLPSAGSFGGPATVSAPPQAAPATEVDPFDPFNPASAPAPAPKLQTPASGLTHADVKAAFAPLLMHDDADAHVLEILGRFGLTKVNECIDKPELHAPLVAAFNDLRKKLGV